MRHGSFHVAHWDPTSYLSERLLIEANVLSWKAEPVPDAFQIGPVQWKGAWMIVCRWRPAAPMLPDGGSFKASAGFQLAFHSKLSVRRAPCEYIVNVNVNDMNQICCKCPRIPDSGLNPFTSSLTACHTHSWAFHTIWCVGEAVLGVLFGEFCLNLGILGLSSLSNNNDWL